jgi:hypothetical protein
MLIKPVQRITKYPLLFDDLLNLTTPVHSDYFGIRRAAELAKGLAREIDELKRRQDVVADALGLGRVGYSPIKDGSRSGRGLKMFKSNSSKNTTTTSLPISRSMTRVPTFSNSGNVLENTVVVIKNSSLEDLRTLVRRVEEADAITKRLGKEIVGWTAGVRECWVSMNGMGESWGRLVGLGEVDEGRVGVWRGVVEGILERVWGELVRSLHHPSDEANPGIE